ncbi:uncharacterized protein CcaverHIS019_0606250 [Cutaneotrichosporon cavernicola]|uniref:Uncharacterized protein n=1 Tax=Cutaneotrichosporon cavernicola TaxID=279322 RepID=A0AA48L967_9TREE|nr:uncharacterized protein CcaverHIS019_0606250 [Cutaneotrichosporon cavernicola]BEI94166.1 hypothetical protein CcaverHIS019_0606250 [Cutaneotrichosporon cavernicola]BEJ01946.1 hypothetical protein CcaverHIS631_0606280 [Cutaneotrichosporon cavernicola]BEJ09710.1 hypothetical protein CcaverHIS641_0606250 [Cutaneotrichosporon cavernicola]
MSSAVETDVRRARQVNSARKKLKQFRASRTSHTPSPSHVSRASSASSGSGTVLNNSTADNTFPRRVPSSSHGKALLDAVIDAEAAGMMDTMSRHARQSSRHQRQRSSMTLSWPPQLNQNITPRPTVMGLFDMPPLEPSGESATKASDTEQSDTATSSREIVTTPATPTVEPSTLHTDREGAAVARLNSFNFGAKPSSNKPALLPSFPIRESSPPKRLGAGRPPSIRLSRSFSPLDLLEGSPRNSISSPNLNNSSSSPQPLPPSRRRHSHNRSESISLPNLKLGRPASLGLPSPGFPSTPSSPMGDVSSSSRSGLSSSQSLTPQSGSRLKFEPSDKEKEESRRRALDKLTGGGSCTPKAPPREEPKPAEISLPMFDDDDDLSTTSSRPPSDALTSTASSSRPSSFTFGSSSSFNSLSASPLPWSQFEDSTERWSFGQSVGQSFAQRFDPKEDAPAFGSFGLEMSGPTKTSSVLLNSSSLGVLTEEDETESDADDEGTDMMSNTSSAAETHEMQESTPAGPTPSRLRELHLVSSVSSQGSSNRRSSNPDVARSLASARETPTKGGYGSIGRGRPRPLALDTSSASAFKAASATSPSKGARPSSLQLGGGRRPLLTRASSISYKKDDSGSGSSHDYSNSRCITSPPSVTGEIASPPSMISPLAEWTSMARGASRPCPRPRSAILGTSGRVLGEVDEEAEDSSFRFFDDGRSTGRASTEASRNSYDGSLWPATARRDSRDRIDAELERDALREDVELWRKRCRGLEEQVEGERREKHVYQDRARKLGDRLLALSAASGAMSPAKEREAAQDRLIAEMRDQLFNLTAALDRERRERKEMVAHMTELQAALDGTRTPQVTPNSLPSTPKSRPRKSSTANMFGTPPEAKYADADFLDAMDDEDGESESAAEGDDNNWRRMRGFAFPQGPVEKMDRESKRESFFGLSRPRAVRAAPSIGGLGLDWATSPIEHGFDLPPIEVNAANRDLVRPASFILKTTTATRTLREREERERAPEYERPRARPPVPTRPLPPIDVTPERPQTSAPPVGGFGLSFLSGYLPIPRTTPPVVPRVLVTPSSVSPKKTPRLLEREMMRHHVVGAAGDIDMRHSCRRCTGEIIEL